MSYLKQILCKMDESSSWEKIDEYKYAYVHVQPWPIVETHEILMQLFYSGIKLILIWSIRHNTNCSAFL